MIGTIMSLGSSTPPQVWPDLPDGRLIDLPERGQLFVRTADGPGGALPVVLLHGWSWTADINFGAVYGPLAQHHRVIAPDVRGHGRSLRPSGHWKLNDAVDDVVMLLDVLGVDRAIFGGFSMGGVLAAATASRYPDRVVGVLAQSSAACYTTDLRDRIILRAIAALALPAHLGLGANLMSRVASLARHSSPDLAQRWEWLESELRTTSLSDLTAVSGAVRRMDLRSTLSAAPVQCPSEYLLLTRDRICRPRLQRDLAERLGAHITTHRADHDFPVVDAARYASFTVESVRRLAARASADSGPTGGDDAR